MSATVVAHLLLHIPKGQEGFVDLFLSGSQCGNGYKTPFSMNYL